MKGALGLRSSPGRDGEDGDQQHDGDGGGDDGDHLGVQRDVDNLTRCSWT